MSFIHSLFCMLGLLGASPLGAEPSADAEPPAEEADVQPRTQVFVLGMLHDAHRTSELWGLEQVRATLKAIDPDLICVEIPPDNWPRTLATWKARKLVLDSRVRVFPEYVDVLLPLTDELRFEVVPCAGWTPEMARARSARIERFNTSEADALPRADYEADQLWVKAWQADHPAPLAEDDPFFIHSPAYDLRTKIELGSYEHHLNPVIGWPGGWTYINHEHFALIREAVEAHPGKRIVVTFGAAHKYWFLEQLRAMPEVQVMDVRPFLPGAAHRPLSPDQAAEDALLLGVDQLRAWWASARDGSTHAWTMIDGMLEFHGKQELIQRLRATRASQPSEFQDGPFLGAVQLESRVGETWNMSLEVRRLGDAPEDAEWLRASLVLEHARPGGFRWSNLELPAWLLEQRAD